MNQLKTKYFISISYFYKGTMNYPYKSSLPSHRPRASHHTSVLLQRQQRWKPRRQLACGVIVLSLRLGVAPSSAHRRGGGCSREPTKTGLKPDSPSAGRRYQSEVSAVQGLPQLFIKAWGSIKSLANGRLRCHRSVSFTPKCLFKV